MNTPEEGTLTEKAAQITISEAVIEGAETEVEYEVEFYANAEAAVFHMLRMGQLWKWTASLRYKIHHCPDVTVESGDGGYPRTITLDYGEGTELRSGKILSGVIVIEISGPRNSQDITRLVTYDNFGVDSILIDGTSIVKISRGNEVFRSFNTDFDITLANGTILERKSERTWEWIEGIDTEMNQNDDVIQITGFSIVKTSTDEYRKEIVEPLIRNRDCRFIVKGVVDITLNGELVSSLDYGDGECNNIAILTKDSETYEVDLSKRMFKRKS